MFWVGFAFGCAAGLAFFAVLVLALGKFAGTRNYLPPAFTREEAS